MKSTSNDFLKQIKKYKYIKEANIPYIVLIIFL